MSIRVLIADDHPVFRRGLRQVIESEADMSIVAEAEDGVSALSLIQSHVPAVAVLDLDMPRLDGLEVIRSIHSVLPDVAVVILTMHKDEDLFKEAMELDVKGFILKDSAVNEIAGSIRAAAAGQYFISPTISTFLVNHSRRSNAILVKAPSISDLTAAERRVLALIAAYKTNKEIAADLNLSPRTVENHRANICQKLDLHGAHSLMRFAIEHRAQLE